MNWTPATEALGVASAAIVIVLDTVLPEAMEVIVVVIGFGDGVGEGVGELLAVE